MSYEPLMDKSFLQKNSKVREKFERWVARKPYKREKEMISLCYFFRGFMLMSLVDVLSKLGFFNKVLGWLLKPAEVIYDCVEDLLCKIDLEGEGFVGGGIVSMIYALPFLFGYWWLHDFTSHSLSFSFISILVVLLHVAVGWGALIIGMTIVCAAVLLVVAVLYFTLVWPFKWAFGGAKGNETKDLIIERSKAFKQNFCPYVLKKVSDKPLD